jgi:hypothetical protein
MGGPPGGLVFKLESLMIMGLLMGKTDGIRLCSSEGACGDGVGIVKKCPLFDIDLHSLQICLE